MTKKIKLAFMISRETFRIEIEGKSIWYTDRRWGRAIRLIPRDENFLKKILFSRGKIPPIIKDLFTLTKKEQEEYNNAKDTRELADICIKDCRRYGAKLLKEEVVSEEPSVNVTPMKPSNNIAVNEPKRGNKDGNL